MRDIIKTERLVLREISLSDAAVFSKYAGDWDIAKMTGSIPFPFPALSAEFKIMHMLSQKRRGLALPYAITLDGLNMIGVMDLFRRSSESDYEIGYWVARPKWGNGYAPEAATALMLEAEETLGVTRFVAGVFSDNPASQRVLIKLGFNKTGSEGLYYSMARLKSQESIGFAREVSQKRSNSLQSEPAMLIETN